MKTHSEEILSNEKLVCYHCGDECEDSSLETGGKVFCCNGCKTVYELLEENNLCNYYAMEEHPGIQVKNDSVRNFDFLDDEQYAKNFVEFDNGEIVSVNFSLPQIHCSSCIWILENLNKLNDAIIYSRVDFLKKEVQLRYFGKKAKLSEIAALLDSIGYTPDLSPENDKARKLLDKQLYYRIGIAGFAFGNIMLLSFPEYLLLGGTLEPWLRSSFGYLSLLLSIPVLLFSAKPYLLSALKGIRKRIINIDVPISLGILVMFFRSSYEVISGVGAGFFDSFAGLVFFLLIGKFFQNKTYQALNFERTYKSYFPVFITVKNKRGETTIPLEKLKTGERFVAKNGEIIPADSVLISERAFIDYSFVTGESAPVEKVSGEFIYAGGKQLGEAIELESVKDVSHSYLTKLWQHSAFRKEESTLENITNGVSKYFTFAVFSVAFLSAIYWLFVEPSLSINVFTAVLIVACPCALALSTPFTLGNSMRIFGRNKFYVKSVNVIEKLAGITQIIFDKTGTITEPGSSKISFEGELNREEFSLVKAAAANSYHPLSREIAASIDAEYRPKFNSFEEIPGKGIEAVFGKRTLKIGSAAFVHGSPEQKNGLATEVNVAIDGLYRGRFIIKNRIRKGFGSVVKALNAKFSLGLISGDGAADREELSKFFPKSTLMLFGKKPEEKLEFIKKMQLGGAKVLMVGDGLNDAGALAQSDVGISISDNVNNFSPACDAILAGDKFNRFADFIFFAKTSRNIIIISFIISFIYNVIGLTFAVTGNLSPLFAAVLMPLSSISVVVFTTLAVNFAAKRKGLV